MSHPITKPKLTPARGKIQDLRDELRNAGDKKDKGYARKKTALKKIVANMTMGNDSGWQRQEHFSRQCLHCSQT